MAEAYGTTGLGFMFWTSSSDETETDSFVAVKSRFDTYAESVHRILQTLPLERPHQPDVGCIIRRLLFEPNDFYLNRAADFAIRNALEQQEPRLTIVSMVFDVDVDNKKITVRLVLSETETQAQFFLQEEIQL